MPGRSRRRRPARAAPRSRRRSIRTTCARARELVVGRVRAEPGPRRDAGARPPLRGRERAGLVVRAFEADRQRLRRTRRGRAEGRARLRSGGPKRRARDHTNASAATRDEQQRDLPAIGDRGEATARAVAVHAFGEHDRAARSPASASPNAALSPRREVRVLERRRVGEEEDLAPPDRLVRQEREVVGADDGVSAPGRRPRTDARAPRCRARRRASGSTPRPRRVAGRLPRRAGRR